MDHWSKAGSDARASAEDRHQPDLGRQAAELEVHEMTLTRSEKSPPQTTRRTRRFRIGLILGVLCVLRGGDVAFAQTCNGMPGPRGTVELKVGGATRMFVVRLTAAYDARK